MFDLVGLAWDAYQFLHSDTGVAILASLLGVSEALAAIPQIEANSIYQAIRNGLKKLVPAPSQG